MAGEDRGAPAAGAGEAEWAGGLHLERQGVPERYQSGRASEKFTACETLAAQELATEEETEYEAVMI